jgi:uncharacterized protein (DUF1684 family)
MDWHLELMDWRLRVGDLWGVLRTREPGPETCAWFREQKDHLLRTHPQSPIPAEQRTDFPGLVYWDYDPAGRVEAEFEAEDGSMTLGLAYPSPALKLIGWLHFDFNGQHLQLGTWWLEGYADGLFVPFRDATAGQESYGGGRYLVDSAKSAGFELDLEHGTAILDFNYAYHPSCAYDPRWNCPLPPVENQLDVPIRLGERLRA